MASSRERNDARHPRRQGSGGGPHPPSGAASRRLETTDAEWIWGPHAVAAALENPRRTRVRRLLAAPGKLEGLRAAISDRDLQVERLSADEIGRLLPAGAVHQGVALLADPLESVPIEDIAEPAAGVLVLLDQVVDPQNVGAIFRCAAAFGARGVILQDRHAPRLGGALSKASAGAVDQVPCARVVNLSRTLEQLADLGWRAVGLAGDAETLLADAFDGSPVVLVLGSEGHGLRRLVSEHCDILAAIPMPGLFESLNVASAAAVALYEASRACAARA